MPSFNPRIWLRSAVELFPEWKKQAKAWLKRPSLEERLRVCEFRTERLMDKVEALERQASASRHPAAGAATDCPPLPRQ